MKPFVVNSHRRLVFPSNFFPEPDFSSIDTIDDLAAIVRRDFEAKAPTGSDIAARAESGGYANRYELLRDLGLHLFWMNRYVITMYEKRPTRWRDVARRRNDIFLPALTPWEDGPRKVAAVESCYPHLPATWSADVEDELYRMLFDVFRHKRHHATDLPAIKPTVAEAVAGGSQLVYRLGSFDPDYPRFSLDDILDCHESVPELEALRRWAMTLHNQYPWDRSDTGLVPVGGLKDDDVVVIYHPRTPDVLDFIRRVKNGARRRPTPPPARPPRQPAAPLPAVQVRSQFAVQPRIEALAVRRGEILCTNDDIVRNSASSWSPMSAAQIAAKTGIESRCYTEGGLENLALDAAVSALDRAGRSPEEIGAVLFCTCTNPRLLPSAATWLSGQLGMFQTHTSVDLVAACAGFPYGLADAVRIMQEVERPILLVCAEKFSDKVGSVRTSRMIFGDAAAGLVVAPAEAGAPGDVDVLQTYASGPVSQVNSIIWPNTEFGCDITVYGPEVRALVSRYLDQMIEELQALPHPDGRPGTLIEAIDLIVPHQANKRMVIDLAEQAGIGRDRMYFNIARVGNTSAASIPLAIHDAVRDGVISAPTRVFTPGFGAGAVAGYAVLRIDPAVVAEEQTAPPESDRTLSPALPHISTSTEVGAALAS
ncbi:MAG: ketoacyl-ACP synthase III [Acidobacteria bacterium]|nr:ketoacyl-ACP synthase III [Acidobacteriota bacterium]MYJ03447.1 ketoacyl-ACP synthase III [Acidobacteriota bacterium]